MIASVKVVAEEGNRNVNINSSPRGARTLVKVAGAAAKVQIPHPGKDPIGIVIVLLVNDGENTLVAGTAGKSQSREKGYETTRIMTTVMMIKVQPAATATVVTVTTASVATATIVIAKKENTRNAPKRNTAARKNQKNQSKNDERLTSHRRMIPSHNNHLLVVLLQIPLASLGSSNPVI